MIAAPLTDLLKKDVFEWTEAAESSFCDLKKAMTTAPVLKLPDFEREFCIETDASDLGIGAVLLQDSHPIAFFSKKLGPRRRMASTYHKELYAIVEAVQKWRQYLLGREFVIRSDQKSLKELLQQVVQTPDQQLYVRKLMGYKFKIEYKKGSTNKAADALSRREDSKAVAVQGLANEEDQEVIVAANILMGQARDGQLLTLAAHLMPTLLDVLRAETDSSPELRAVMASIKEGKALPKLSFMDGLIYYDRRIYVSSDSPSRRVLLEEYHCSPSAGHPGWERTFRRLAAGFYWSNMRKDVKRFVEACVTCQSTKYSTQKPAGLLQPLPIPSQVWEDVSMDFITGLPPSRGYTSIMAVVDRLSKYAHFAPLPIPFDALRVAHIFINTVVCHHGFPKTLVSDRDSVFLNAVWEEMLTLSGTKLHFSTAHHPQSDGQTEVRNWGLEQYLRAFTADIPSKWSNFLPWAELALNCFHHAGLGTSPYKALYGREPPSLVASQPSAKTPPTVAELIRQRGILLVQLRKNLEKAQQRKRASANRHRRHVEFDVGDLVWLKLQPYRQHSVVRPQLAKLAHRFYGPYKILQRIGPVAYKLRLPEGSRPIVHPVQMLDRKIFWHEGKPADHVLVRWSDGTDSPSWEPLEKMRECYPDLLLEDKEAAMGEGVDTTITPSTVKPTDNPPSSHTQGESSVDKRKKPARSASKHRGERTAVRSERPRRNVKPPYRFQEYVSK